MKNHILLHTIIAFFATSIHSHDIASKNSDDFFECAHASIQLLENTLDNARPILNYITCISSNSEHTHAWFEKFFTNLENLLTQQTTQHKTLEMHVQWLWHCTYLVRTLTKALHSNGSDLENLDALATHAATEYFLELVTDAHIEKAYKELQKSLTALEITIKQISYKMEHGYKPWHKIIIKNLNELWKIRAFKAVCALGLLTASYGLLYYAMIYNEPSRNIIS